MKLRDAIALIRPTKMIADRPSVWADLGCGSGLFTHALATMLHKSSTIYAVDQNPSLASDVTHDTVHITVLKADFEKEDLPFNNLDGILMANALHYVKDKRPFIGRLKNLLKKNGLLLVVEYDSDKAVEKWVPYPLSYESLQQLFHGEGYSDIQKLHEHPSVYGNGNLYSSLILP
ncbi:MAG: class I SAM-dependent methyltransferase [Chitinophagaceae bacterium]|nr:class I SAM-dependent methyltransferase [Chitinophagaceae bacterium]